MKNFKLIFLFSGLMFLGACSETLYTEGNYIFPYKIKEIQVGKTKADLIEILGVPSTQASFDENILYYYYERTEQKIRFLERNIIESKIIILEFDENDKLKNFKILDHLNRRTIPVEKATTVSTAKKIRRTSNTEDIDAFDVN